MFAWREGECKVKVKVMRSSDAEMWRTEVV